MRHQRFKIPLLNDRTLLAIAGYMATIGALAISNSTAQTPNAPLVRETGHVSPTRFDESAAAICPIVYPMDESPSTHGYQYAFYGNAFFINRDGYLITAAHVLHSFRNGGDPHILVQRADAPPQMLKADVVLEDHEHDVAVLRATPNPFAGKAYRVGTLAPDATPVARGEGIVVAGGGAKRRIPHRFETELEDHSAASVIDFQSSVLEKGFGETELVLFNHEVILGQSGAPVLAAGTGEVIAFIEGQWLRPAAGLAVEMQRGQEASSVGAAVPIRYAVETLRGKGIAWGEEHEARKQ
jgi:S1-C subfamily serine protease